MDPEKTDRDEWRIPVRNGQETEKGEAETILGSGGAGRRKKKTDFHADRLSAHSPVPQTLQIPEQGSAAVGGVPRRSGVSITGDSF